MNMTATILIIALFVTDVLAIVNITTMESVLAKVVHKMMCCHCYFDEQLKCNGVV